MTAAARPSQTSSDTAESIPFLDLVSPHRALEEELVQVFRTALRGAAFIGGDQVANFETEFADFVGTPWASAVSSGTDALRFAYMAMDLKPGDEIITVSHTFMATTEAITQAGGTIRFVDIQPDTMTMDPAALEAAITPRTVGIVPVHLYGQPADMDPILATARKNALWVIEDAAQAHGATYRGKPVGSLGVMSAFSFYPGKNLGACGEAGATAGLKPEHLAVVRRLREHGQATKYYHDSEGYNGRLDAIQAGILRVKLRHLRDWNDRRRKNAALYREALADIPEVTLPVEADYAHHVYHLFVIRVDDRDALQQHLASRKIATGLHYPLPLHLQRAYAGRGWREGQFPVTERTAATLLSLPMFPELTASNIERVADSIRSFYRG